MHAPAELTEVYQEYEKALGKVIQEASAFAGAFHIGDDPRNHACNGIFFEKVKQWAESFSLSEPEEEECEAAVQWLLFYPADHRDEPSYWYAYAAQQHAIALVPLLNCRDAGRLLERYEREYPRQDRMPVQQELVRRLREQAGSSEKTGEGTLRIWAVRVALLLLGLTIAHLGVTLFLLADLGSDPFNVMIQGIFRHVQIATHGTVHAAVSLLIVAILLVVDRSYVRIGTFLCMVLGGPIIDVFTKLLTPVISASSNMAPRIGAVVLGCGILALGMTIVIRSQAGTGPNDLVALVISDKLKKKFGPIRVAVDACFAVTGFVLGGTVGVGTLICMAVVGPVAQAFMPYSEKLCAAILKAAEKKDTI